MIPRGANLNGNSAIGSRTGTRFRACWGLVMLIRIITAPRGIKPERRRDGPFESRRKAVSEVS